MGAAIVVIVVHAVSAAEMRVLNAHVHGFAVHLLIELVQGLGYQKILAIHLQVVSQIYFVDL